MTPTIQWERIKDTRPQFASLHAALYGPIVLAGFTYGERALPFDAALVPVTPGERSNLKSLRVRLPDESNGAQLAAGCLVSRWSSAWLIRPDKARHHLPRPPPDCLARATPIEDTLSSFAQVNGGGK